MTVTGPGNPASVFQGSRPVPRRLSDTVPLMRFLSFLQESLIRGAEGRTASSKPVHHTTNP